MIRWGYTRNHTGSNEGTMRHEQPASLIPPTMLELERLQRQHPDCAWDAFGCKCRGRGVYESASGEWVDCPFHAPQDLADLVSDAARPAPERAAADQWDDTRIVSFVSDQLVLVVMLIAIVLFALVRFA